MSVNTLAARLQYYGGGRLDRLIQNKLVSFKSALKNSYNSRRIKTPSGESWRCLINEDKLTANYDKKILSIEYASGLQPGDVFEVLDDGSKWMVYLPHLAEKAYLRANIIRCRYTVDVNGTDYWVYFQGPLETTAKWFIKQDVNINQMNLDGTIYVKQTPETDVFFARHRKLSLGGRSWEIGATDRLSVPGVIEAVVRETFSDPIAELPSVKLEDPMHQIIGPTKVKQDTLNGYEIRHGFIRDDCSWWVEGNPRVKAEPAKDGAFCNVRVYDGAVDGFRLFYGTKQSSYHLDVEIDWECPSIFGDTTVRPYDVAEYRSKDGCGSFYVQTDAAKVLSQDGNSCKLEITASKSCEFTLYCDKDDGTVDTLAIQVESL